MESWLPLKKFQQHKQKKRPRSFFLALIKKKKSHIPIFFQVTYSSWVQYQRELWAGTSAIPQPFGSQLEGPDDKPSSSPLLAGLGKLQGKIRHHETSWCCKFCKPMNIMDFCFGNSCVVGTDTQTVQQVQQDGQFLKWFKWTKTQWTNIKKSTIKMQHELWKSMLNQIY